MGDDEIRETVALLFHRRGIGQRQLMRQPFLRVGDANSVAEKICMGVHGAKSALYSVLMPVEWNDLVLLVISRVCHDTTLRRARGAIGRAILSDATALFRCVIRLCGGSVEGEEVDGPRSPDFCVSFC
ncbi:hypothetical protein TcCL_ESM08555 [Trypanosoma cruzi]|nr:hypothetical protein TcCL_ESM08555 [Trypanosoma cruzi]